MTFPRAAIDEAFSLLPKAMDSTLARVLHAAIGWQESRYLHRRQVIEVQREFKEAGPACGYWQFERGGGVKGVMNFGGTVTKEAKRVCQLRGIEWNREKIWLSLSQDDVLAAAFARLLMYTDPYRLPGSTQEGWELYQRVWRPGKPHPQTWAAAYAFALEQYS